MLNNNLKPAGQMKDKVVEYEVNGSQVRLSPSIVRNYLVNGDGRVTDGEVAMFINLCRYQRLNPLIRDAYLIKFGSQPATIVTGKDAILKRAVRNPKYAGHEAGVILQREDGSLEYRTGAMVLPAEILVGGWAKTYVTGYQCPIESTVSFDEYAGRKKGGELNTMWAGKPGVMIRKVALVASVREAFPEDLGGLYSTEELGDDIPIDETPVEIPDQPEPQEEQDQTVLDYPGNF